MSKITDFAAQEEATLTTLGAKLDGIAVGVANLDALIVTLQGAISDPTAEEQAALDAVLKASSDLVAKAAAINTVVPVVPVAPGAPTA